MTVLAPAPPAPPAASVRPPTPDATPAGPDDEADAARSALIHTLDVGGGLADGVLDGLVRCAARLCGCPMAAVTLVGRTRQWLPARTGLDAAEIPREWSLCAHALLGDGLLEIDDLHADARFCRHPVVQADPRLRFYAGVPFAVDGVPLGALCILDTQPRRLQPQDRALLADLARAVGSWFQARRKQQQDQLRRELLDEVARDVVGLVLQVREDGGTGPGRLVVDFDNGRLEPIFELDRADVEQDPRRLLVRVHAADRPALLEALRQARDVGAPVDIVVRLVRPRRGAGWAAIHGGTSRRPGGGRVWNFFVADVSERMRAQEEADAAHRRWQTAVDAAELGLVTVAPADARVHLDARAAAQHGLPPRPATLPLDDWLGRFALAAPARDALRRQLIEIGEGQTVALEVALDVVVDGDEPAPRLELIAQASSDGHGRLQVLGTCRDVTARLRLLQLRAQKEAAEAASREKSRFLSRASHELRTPLNAVLGFSHLLANGVPGPLTPQQSDYLQRIRQAGELLLKLVDDLLSLQRVEEAPVASRPLDVAATVRDCVRMLENGAADAGVRFALRTEAAPVWVLGDARAVEQVLLNLMSNGIKYNRHGGSLTVEVRRDGGRVRVAVSDEGGGIAPEQRDRLFQPFERLGAEHGAVPGHGLGLSIAKQLVEAMQGRLEVQSRPGGGTTFTVELPAVGDFAAAPADAGPGAVVAGHRDTMPPQAPATLLYVEDEPVNAMLVREALRRCPAWQLLVACSGREGLALAREHRPALVLVDMHLPDMSGIELARALQADDRTRWIRRVALSADAMPEQVRAARDAGFDAYWTKPIDVVRLPELVASMLAPPFRRTTQ